ncbi:Neuropeptide-Like Protein [Caenorhabditis elegans]|uniref:Neuropeptide-Like Protein n=1 Tax=Caenorhabditis elegans TaxID=6239 RepID=B5BM38_CAEEL|nr:Neuropeptide-Like Protein [Caenorhabditis elegans]CAR31488.1 Neuropeptide-Like Protein [Caenorhabditis elegans]|eukprot:NP_001129771.1 Uncharacterized protein CELE_F36D1.12 [Caenorhabditis elegans]
MSSTLLWVFVLMLAPSLGNTKPMLHFLEGHLSRVDLCLSMFETAGVRRSKEDIYQECYENPSAFFSIEAPSTTTPQPSTSEI